MINAAASLRQYVGQWCGMNIVDGRNPKGEIGQSLLPDPKGEIGQSLVPRAKGKIGQSPVALMGGRGSTTEESKRELGGQGARLLGLVRASGLQRLTAQTWQWRPGIAHGPAERPVLLARCHT